MASVDAARCREWPAEYEAWARGEGVLDRVVSLRTAAAPLVPPDPRSRIPTTSLPHAARTPSRTARSSLRIVSPPDGAVYLIDPTLRRDFQTLPLRGVGVDRALVEWLIDNHEVGRAEASSTIDWPLVAGPHTITARTDGHAAEVAIVVK